MTALASIDDYTAITGQAPSSAETSRLNRLLEAASESVLAGAHGQNIVSTVYTAQTVYNRDGRFWLPQRPVTAVASVVVDGVTLTHGTHYRWTPGGDGRPALIIRRVSGVDSVWNTAEASVTYTAGWATVPWPIRAAVCVTAKQVFQGSAMSPYGAVSPSGDFGETYPASMLDHLPMRLLPSTRKVIDEWTMVDRASSVEYA